MFMFDLKSGYHHVSINKNFVKFLGFSWVFNGKVRYFVFSSFTFWYKISQSLFYKIIKAISKVLESQRVLYSRLFR